MSQIFYRGGIARWVIPFLLLMSQFTAVVDAYSQDKPADKPEVKSEDKKAEDTKGEDKKTDDTKGDDKKGDDKTADPPAPISPKAMSDKQYEEARLAKNTDLKVMADTVWVMVTGMLVFFMNLGFATVESGMCRAKNAVNILSKNFVVFAATAIMFWFIGFGLMFGDGAGPLENFIGAKGLFFVNNGVDGSPFTKVDYRGDYSALNWTGVPLWAKFFFQLVFAGTAATIVSGAVAERIKYGTFIVFSLIMGAVIYPIVGHWIWGGGFLGDMGFHDFAGSTQVHSIGGWAALTGAIILGPRLGKYSAEGKAQAIPGHNMTAATIGCLILWLGWFGFNPGSTMAVDPNAIALVAVNTNAAAVAATLTATIATWCMMGKPDIGMTLNGCLAGLVAITAPCAVVDPNVATGIGAVAGVLVVLAVLMFDKLHVDDPVGATSVHLVNGVFGTLCVGLFCQTEDKDAGRTLGLFYGGGFNQLITQLIGIASVAVFVLIVSAVAWLALKYTMGLRVSKEEEIEGLDIGEHGNEAYHGFQMVPDDKG